MTQFVDVMGYIRWPQVPWLVTAVAVASGCASSGNANAGTGAGAGSSGASPAGSAAPSVGGSSAGFGNSSGGVSNTLGGSAGTSGMAGTGNVSGAQGGDAAGGAPPIDPARPAPPSGLMVELTTHPELMALSDATPEFSWVVNSARSNVTQTAYRILVAQSEPTLAANTGDLWDSGKVLSANSVNVAYAGKALLASSSGFWKVQTWDGSDQGSEFSTAQKFTMAANLTPYRTPSPSVVQTAVTPSKVSVLGAGHYFLDFGRAAFGWVELTLDAPTDGTSITVNLGEKANGQAVDMAPGASIRAARVQLSLQKGIHTYRVMTPKDSTNTSSPAIPLPASLGVVMPFRYVEVSNSPVALDMASARQIAVTYPFDDAASAFSSSNSGLNQVWALAKYSIKATTFAGIYIDGDRERTPYEADAYLQQLGHYGVDRDYAIARYSHEYLMVHPTWPTEWKSHSIMLAWADWMYTGNTESLAQQYALLKQEKTLERYMNSDGLLNTASLRDIVDWPAGERDGYVLVGVNTVVNSFWCYALGLMSDIAAAIGNQTDATRYRTLQTTAIAALNAKLFDPSTGLYLDGQGTSHSALHANLFPLAFGLVPAERKAKVVSFVKSRAMACSVYGAQYLLEALYQAQEPDAALALLSATNDRSWLGMLSAGSTITLEAWAEKYKPNLDWNHAWGAAPANILPRFILGVRPLTPGFAEALIQPQPGALTHVEGTVPTVRGPIQVSVDAQPFKLSVTLPANMIASVAVPTTVAGCTPLLDGQAATVSMTSGAALINQVGSGQHVISCQ